MVFTNAEFECEQPPECLEAIEAQHCARYGEDASYHKGWGKHDIRGRIGSGKYEFRKNRSRNRVGRVIPGQDDKDLCDTKGGVNVLEKIRPDQKCGVVAILVDQY
jgi:hypothetical protein